MKAVVLERTGKTCTVLCQDGTFQNIKVRHSLEVGSEIQLRQKVNFTPRQWASIAAVFLLIIGATLGWNLWQPPAAVAYVSVDINPSLEMGLDKAGNVVSIKPFNDDAKQVISAIPYKNQPITSVLTMIIDRAIALHFLTQEQNLIILGVTPANAKVSTLPPSANLEDLYNLADKEMLSHSIHPDVAVMEISKQENDLAKKKGLTPGQFALLEQAQSAGKSPTPQSVQDKKERIKLYHDPAVKQQIEHDKNAVCTPSSKEQHIRQSKPVESSENNNMVTQPGQSNDSKLPKSNKEMDSGKENKPKNTKNSKKMFNYLAPFNSGVK